MKFPHITSGQPVDPAKKVRAKDLRRGMTPAKQLLLSRLRRDQLRGLHFRRQQVIHGFIADFYCHAAGVIVELDGPVHDGRQGYDAEREKILRGHGSRIVRFTNDEVLRAMDQVLAAIATACGVNPSPQPPSPEVEGGLPAPTPARSASRSAPLAPPPTSGEGPGGRGPRP